MIYTDIKLVKPQVGEPLFAEGLWTPELLNLSTDVNRFHDSERGLATLVRNWLTPTELGGQAQATRIIREAVAIGGESLYQAESFPVSTHSNIESSWKHRIEFIKFLQKNGPQKFRDSHDELNLGNHGNFELLADNIHKILIGLNILVAWETLFIKCSDKQPTNIQIKEFDEFEKHDWYPLISFLACGPRGLLVTPKGASKNHTVSEALGIYSIFSP